MKNILITGATGMIGQVLLSILSSNHDYNFWIMSRNLINSTSAEIVVHDLKDPIKYEKMPSKIDYIIHLAQANNYKDFIKDRKDIFDVNVMGMVNLLNYALETGAEKFIYASSGGVYGPSSNILSEQDRIPCRNKLDFYLNSKLCAEIMAQNFEKYFDIITLRIFFAYGPHQNCNMLMPRLIHNIKNYNRIILHSETGTRINPIYALDVAKAIESALHIKGSHIYNIAGCQRVTIKDISYIIGEVLNIAPIFEVLEDDAQDIVADNSKMIRELALPEISLQEGIAHMINLKGNN